MQLRLEALEPHLAKGLAGLYTVYGDEPLLAQEACDRIRAAARAAGFTERSVFTVERGFDWSSLLGASPGDVAVRRAPTDRVAHSVGQAGQGRRRRAEDAGRGGQSRRADARHAAAPRCGHAEVRLVHRAGQRRRRAEDRPGRSRATAELDRPAARRAGPARGARRRWPARAAVHRRARRGQPAGRAPGNPEARAALSARHAVLRAGAGRRAQRGALRRLQAQRGDAGRRRRPARAHDRRAEGRGRGAGARAVGRRRGIAHAAAHQARDRRPASRSPCCCARTASGGRASV